MHNPNLNRMARLLASAGLLTAVVPAFADVPDQAGSDAKHGLQEVVVTAQKVAQSASKTPIALSVIGAEELKSAGIHEARSLAAAIPNVHIGQESGKLQIAIRGVSSLDMTPKGDPSTSFNLDGANVPRPEAQMGAFFDVDRIEVLRGPQGTLYGRNATAGAINVITARPEYRLGGSASVELGNYGTRRVDGAVNLPVNDVLALRAAISVNRHDTYYNPGPNTDIPLADQDDRAARLHALATFSKDTTLLLTAETSRMKGGGATPIPMMNFFDGTQVDNLPLSPMGIGNNIANPVYVDRGATTQLTPSLRFASPDAYSDNRAHSLRGEFGTRVGSVGLTYQLARLKTDIGGLHNGTYFGFPFNSDVSGDSSALSHELRLNSTGNGPLRWVAGLYAFDEDIDQSMTHYTYAVTPGGPRTITVPYLPHVNNKSKAAFGQATYSLRDDTRLTVGLRRTIDEKSGSDPLAGVVAAPGQSASTGAYDIAVKYTDTSWKLGLDHDLMPGLLAFASVSTGYKAGGFNDKKNAGTYRPEGLKAYEAGVKGRLLDNRLQLAASYFYYDYTDMQLTATVCTSPDPTSCGSVTTNAANSTVKGLELEATAMIGENGTLRANAALTRARFDAYRPNATRDWSGESLDRAPETTLGLGYTHYFPLDSGAELSATVGTRYSAAYLISDPSAGIRYRQPSHTKSELTLGYRAPGDRYTIQLFAKNLENEITIESRVPGSFFVGDPRTFGLRASTTF
ncbi:TonB-dependent receptor [Telluria beijingensis]|uniref:TonB-dependent receptor n=1 Tax=Telluria beijingensis TaxID=3068633 RepID=UPI00279551A0|nr:TonB-dependent receptor [Massilia sp. REN29]